MSSATTTARGPDNLETQTFIDAVRTRLVDLAQRDGVLASQIQGLASRIEQLTAERAELARQRRELLAARQAYAELMGVALEPLPEPPQPAESRPLSISDLAEQYLEDRGGRAKVTDLVRALEHAQRLGGVRKNHYPTVFAVLRRDRRFQRTARGEFSLASRTRPQPVHRTSVPSELAHEPVS